NNLEPTNVVVAAISPSGQDFATVDSHGKAVLQNTQDKTNDPIENNGPIKSVAISSDGNYVATGDETGNVQLWDVTNKKKIAINTDKKFKHEKEVLSVTINAYKNNIKIVSGGADGKV
ncbi:MAG: WD40 repeat domain-containing protein, partial [Nostoc sp.]